MKNISFNLKRKPFVIIIFILISGVLCSFYVLDNLKIDNKPQNKATNSSNKSSLVIKASDSKIGFKDSNPTKRLKINKFEK